MTVTLDRRTALRAGAPLFAGVDAEGLASVAARAIEVEFGAAVPEVFQAIAEAKQGRAHVLAAALVDQVLHHIQDKIDIVLGSHDP